MASTLLLALSCAPACKGGLQQRELTDKDKPATNNKTSNNKNPNNPNNPNTPPVIDPDLCAQKGDCGQERPADGLRLVRMTHPQWEQATRDVLKLDAPTGLSESFYDDPLGSGNFDNDAQVLEVSTQLWDHYREAAEALATQTVASPERLERLLSMDAPTSGKPQARALIEQVGARAWRRPLTTQEIETLLALYDRAPEMFNDGDMHKRGLELVLRSILQSPHFIYRVELAHSADGQPVALSGYERAAKLAMALWSSVPDDALLAAAASGELDTDEGVAKQAARMLEDDRARRALLYFYQQLYKTPSFDKLEKNAERFPNFSASAARAMRQEMERFIEDTIFERSGGLKALLTSRRTFINAELAALYGVSGDFGQELTPAELPAAERAGLLTRLGFLAYNGTAYEQNTIHRGVFINHHVLCAPLPPAPTSFELPDVITGQTNRQRIESATSACGGACHNIFINPAGYAFERYDGIGVYQVKEGEQAVDSAASFKLNGELTPYQDAVEFSELMSQSIEAHECYSRHLVEFLYGKVPTPNEEPLVKRLGWRSLNEDLSIKELVIAAVTSPAFLSRQANQEQP